MLRSKLLHPELLAALAGAGHGSKVLIADSNYPFDTVAGPNARIVYLNLSPGRVLVTEVLEAILSAAPVEAAHVMLPESGEEPPIFNEFRAGIPGVHLQPIGRHAFYDMARSPDTALVVATGEQRLYACLMLTLGVVAPD